MVRRIADGWKYGKTGMRCITRSRWCRPKVLSFGRLNLSAGNFLVVENRFEVHGGVHIAAVVGHWEFIFHLAADQARLRRSRGLGDPMTFDLVLDSHQALEQRFGAGR